MIPNSFEVVHDPDDAEDVDFVVCRRLTSPLLEPDNLIDLCCKCGEAIQHRPHIPKGPPKVCDPCIIPILDSEAEKGELHMMITPKTALEIEEWLRKKKAN